MRRSLRILMVTHMPWDRNLGGPRVQLELGEELERLGCTIEKFDVNDAFGSGGFDKWLRRLSSNFPARAREFIRAHGHRFDVIDAHLFNLPYAKSELGFPGLLVARSVGLLPLYLDFAEKLDRHSPRSAARRRATMRFDHARMKRQFHRSAQFADLVNVSNRSDMNWVKTRYPGKAVVEIPFGFSASRREQFRAQLTCRDRLARLVVSVASWEARKGLADWPAIVRMVRSRVPDARFKFCGTGASRETVLRDLGQPDCEWIDVKPRFESEELPSILAEASVGAFPSHLDGFGYGVIEMLAAGLPTVVYDIPGPGDIVRRVDSSWCIRRNNVGGFADRICALLELDAKSYAGVARASLGAMDRYRLEEIAESTLRTYAEALDSRRMN